MVARFAAWLRERWVRCRGSDTVARMLIEHRGKRPDIAASAWVAPNAVVCGDVRVGEHCRVLFGAVLSADGGPVELGSNVIVMEHALVRGRPEHGVRIGDHVIIGPHAHVNGAQIEDCCFIATGAGVFPGAHLGKGAEVRVNGVVHVNSTVAPDEVVPIGWVAVGDPAQIFPPDEHERIWAIQSELDFPRTAFGLDRAPASELMPRATRHYAELFGNHQGDVILPPPTGER